MDSSSDRWQRHWIGKVSPLARRILGFNLTALGVLIGCILWTWDTDISSGLAGDLRLLSEAEVIAEVIETRFSEQSAGLNQQEIEAVLLDALRGLRLRKGLTVGLYSSDLIWLSGAKGSQPSSEISGASARGKPTPILSFFKVASEFFHQVFFLPRPEPLSLKEYMTFGAEASKDGGLLHHGDFISDQGPGAFVSTAIVHDGSVVGLLAVTENTADLVQQRANDLEKLLQIFVIAILAVMVLSVYLASTISTPISTLAEAMETRGDPEGGNRSKAWMEIPDLSGRPDEIGRLSSALRAMVTALYDRIDANERFATDVAHEIKNPLASLRAAVGAMAIAKPGSQRQELLDVIDHDVRRLDRLLSDISNASRLESDLVKEQEKAFELGPMIAALSQYLAEQAAQKGVELVTDFPDEKITVVGLEERLAQVFVNLITNAISFCSFGGTIRFWARQRDNRVLIVVEDTGPGLSDDSLVKIFDRFYSDRPASDFGNHSGLGLAISKQIVEAHRGVVWAENIRPVDADKSVPSQGARFVVGLPI